MSTVDAPEGTAVACRSARLIAAIRTVAGWQIANYVRNRTDPSERMPLHPKKLCSPVVVIDKLCGNGFARTVAAHEGLAAFLVILLFGHRDPLQHHR